MQTNRTPLTTSLEPRDAVLNCRCSEGLKDAVQEAARRIGVPRSEWMRMVLALASGFETRVPTVVELMRVLDSEVRRRAAG